MDTGELIHKVERVRMRASLSDSSLKNAGSRVRSGWKADASIARIQTTCAFTKAVLVRPRTGVGGSTYLKV